MSEREDGARGGTTITNNKSSDPKNLSQHIAMTPDKKTADRLEGAAVFVAGGRQKYMRAVAEAAGAKVVEHLTPNVDILVGDDDNQLVQQAHDLGVDVWTDRELITAAGAAPPPPPPSNNKHDTVCKKTVYVQRYPALPGDAVSNNGMATPLAYSWLDGASSAEIELELRFLFVVAVDDVLRLMDSRGCDVPISTAMPNGMLLTLQLVPTTPSAPPRHLVHQLSRRFNAGTCTINPRSARRSLAVPIRSAIRKRQHENEQWPHRPAKKRASSSLALTLEPPQGVPTKLDHVEEGHADEVQNQWRRCDDVATRHEELTNTVVSKAPSTQAASECAADDADSEPGQTTAKNSAIPVLAVEELTASKSASQPGVAAAGKAKLRKLVDSAKVVIKKVSDKVAAVQQSSFTAPTAHTASEPECVPHGGMCTAAALRSAHKQARNWLPSRQHV